MTVNELIEELTRYRNMGGGDDPIYLNITDSTGCGKYHGAALHRVEPSDGLESIELLDEETP